MSDGSASAPARGSAAPRTRVHGLNVSLDGFAAGEHVTLDEPIGAAIGLFERFDGRAIHGIDGVDGRWAVDHALTASWGQGVGAEIMGRRKFGPQRGPWEAGDDWRGWWGDDPPFRTPVFVMTHHARDPIRFDNGTSFHFVDGPAEEVLDRARAAAGGLDVRLGGGPSSIRQFLAADLVDFLHVVTVPIVLGRGVPLWDGLEGVQERFDVETVTTSSGLVHQFWNRARV